MAVLALAMTLALALSACSQTPSSDAPVTLPAPIFVGTQSPPTDLDTGAISIARAAEATAEATAGAPAGAPRTQSASSTPAAPDAGSGQLVWHRAQSGIETLLAQRTVNTKTEVVLLARVNPQNATVHVVYSPDAPKSARDWQEETKADLVINGGFFDDKNRVTGLLIASGQHFGTSYVGFGGMFSWRASGRRRGPALQWLRDQPSRADPSITQAVQGFPMLVVGGARISSISDNGQANRRSFVALDGEGRLIFGVTQLAQWTLNDLADFLDQASDLNIVSALNLDGGASSGLWLSGAQADISMNSFEPVPAVITLQMRS